MPKTAQNQLEVHIEQLIRMTALLHRRLTDAEQELSELKAAFRRAEIGKTAAEYEKPGQAGIPGRIDHVV